VLLDLERALRDFGLDHVAIREPDPPWSGALMAIGLRPLRRSRAVRKVLGHLRLAVPPQTEGDPP